MSDQPRKRQRRIAEDGKMDFSRGGCPPDAHEGVAAWINARIDAALEAEAKRAWPRRYLGGSRLGQECVRALAFEYREAAEARRIMREQEQRGEQPVNPYCRTTGRQARIFRDGHRIEEQVVADLRAAGFTILNISPETGRQYGWVIADGRIRGHIDGVVIAGPTATIGYPCLLEIKSMNNKKWTECKEKGVAVSHPIYFYQMQLYMAYMQLHQHPAWFVIYNKDTSEYWHEFVPYDAAAAQKASDNGARVLEASSPYDLPRAAASEEMPPCRFCDYRVQCWSPPQAQVFAPDAAIVEKPSWLSPS